MNLKEAFRYQNKIQAFMDEAQGILNRDANVTKVENTYLRHKVMAEAEDETVLIAPETEYYEQIIIALHPYIRTALSSPLSFLLPN